MPNNFDKTYKNNTTSPSIPRTTPLDEPIHSDSMVADDRYSSVASRKGSGSLNDLKTPIVQSALYFKNPQYQTFATLPRQTGSLANFRVIGTGGAGGVMLEHGTGNVALKVSGAGEGAGTRVVAFQNSDFSTYLELIDNDDGTYDLIASEAITVASSRKFKSGIKPLVYGLSTIQALQPVSYTLKSTKQRHLGFIAEDVMKELPTISDGKKIAYEEIIPVLTKALQELATRVEWLERPWYRKLIDFIW